MIPYMGQEKHQHEIKPNTVKKKLILLHYFTN